MSKLESKDPKFERSAVHPYLLVRKPPTRPLRKNRQPISRPASIPPDTATTLRQTREYALGTSWFLEAYMETLVRNIFNIVAVAAAAQAGYELGWDDARQDMASHNR